MSDSTLAIPLQKNVGHMATVFLFAVTIFTSAYLLFQIQPLISKYILPWFGGSPAVWTAAMLFFQSVLFAGYLYAHLLGRLKSLGRQLVIHGVLVMLASAVAIYLLPSESSRPTGQETPMLTILLLLATSVGLPYFCLATTGPLIQHWFAQTGAKGSVYRLYALSNVASLLALLSFPYVLEPWLPVQEIAQIWTLGFFGFALLCLAVCAFMFKMTKLNTSGENSLSHEVPSPQSGSFWAVPLKSRLVWILLPALSSLAFIATTDYITHDIAPEPRIWIWTLGLYLLSFIISFDHPRWYRQFWVALAVVLLIGWTTGGYLLELWFGIESGYTVAELRWAHLSTMFLVCFMCHGELYRRRPSDKTYLTDFYLSLALGGAMGGLFVALVATNLFSDYHEWPLYLVVSAALATYVLTRSLAIGRKVAVALALVLSLAVLIMEDSLGFLTPDDPEVVDVVLAQERNFYGTVGVIERRYSNNPKDNARIFYSGNIVHGAQYIDPTLRGEPVAYYSHGSGVGKTLSYAAATRSAMRVGVIGMGVGTLASYAREQDEYDFYEINPQVVDIAWKQFDYLSSCKAKKTKVFLGDARLKMQELPADRQYDVIVMDAFSGSSVPIHLLTAEAFAMYHQQLKPGGFIVVNITNRYLNLYPVIQRQAERLGIGHTNFFQTSDRSRRIIRNHFIVLTRDAAFLQANPKQNRKIYNDAGEVVREESLDIPQVPLWTDRFSSLSLIELETR